MLPVSTARFLATWLAMAVAMTANGIFRELVLKRLAGSTLAPVISAVIGILFDPHHYKNRLWNGDDCADSVARICECDARADDGGVRERTRRTRRSQVERSATRALRDLAWGAVADRPRGACLHAFSLGTKSGRRQVTRVASSALSTCFFADTAAFSSRRSFRSSAVSQRAGIGAKRQRSPFASKVSQPSSNPLE